VSAQSLVWKCIDPIHFLPPGADKEPDLLSRKILIASNEYYLHHPQKHLPYTQDKNFLPREFASGFQNLIL
jgi:hypothetical protein